MAGNAGAPVFIPPFTVGQLTTATAAAGSVTAGDKATAAGTASTAPLGGVTATDV